MYLATPLRFFCFLITPRTAEKYLITYLVPPSLLKSHVQEKMMFSCPSMSLSSNFVSLDREGRSSICVWVPAASVEGIAGRLFANRMVLFSVELKMLPLPNQSKRTMAATFSTLAEQSYGSQAWSRTTYRCT